MGMAVNAAIPYIPRNPKHSIPRHSIPKPFIPKPHGGDGVQTLSIDIETFSSVDLSKAGVYKYAESSDFQILLFGYSVDGGPVKVVDLASGESIPDDVLAALTDETVIKWAFNANFERVCLSRYLSDLGRLASDPSAPASDHLLGSPRFLSPTSWRCTMVWAAYLGLPLSLAEVGGVLGLEKQKLTEGKDLIRLFCVPAKDGIQLFCVPAEDGIRRLPMYDPEKWKRFKAYNQRDVETEMEIQRRLANFPVPDAVWEQYHLDQKINDRGIAVDTTLVERAIAMDGQSRVELTDMIQQLTNLDNPNSVHQMKQWLANNGVEIESLGKKQVIELLRDAPPLLRDVLLLRQQLAKSSVKKYFAMQKAVCADGRVHGMFQFYGANRTGRFSSKIVQMQNLAQNHLPDLAAARALVRNGDYEAVQMLYGSVPDTLSELVRTAFIPAPGKKLIVADFSAIEARVIAWLAGEDWRMELFRQGGDIYCQSASQMFKVPVVKHGINGHLRQKGKIAELACGYGGSVGALTAMGALDMGLQEEELAPLVQAWRTSNPNIVKLWWDIDDAAMTAVRNRSAITTHGITISATRGMMFITLPSGRRLAYVKPQLGMNQFGAPAITYMGIGATKKWERIETYGPKLVENIVQGIARDILCYAMQTLRKCAIVAHVHDELLIEADPAMSLDDVCQQMARTPPWAEGLLLRADGYECDFYRKD